MEDDTELCGAETTSGDPSQNAANICPCHDTDDPPDTGRESLLEKRPELTDLVADRLAAGDTIPEACAEVDGMTEDKYYSWRRQAKQDDAKTEYVKFHKETARARRQAGKRDRAELKQAMRNADDTRGWLKLHMNQYGDAYGDEDTDMREGTEIVIHESEDTYTDAIQN